MPKILTSMQTALAIVAVLPDWLEVKGFGLQESRTLKFASQMPLKNGLSAY
jgi:hypothetical protein